MTTIAITTCFLWFFFLLFWTNKNNNNTDLDKDMKKKKNWFLSLTKLLKKEWKKKANIDLFSKGYSVQPGNKWLWEGRVKQEICKRLSHGERKTLECLRIEFVSGCSRWKGQRSGENRKRDKNKYWMRRKTGSSQVWGLTKVMTSANV